MNGIKQFFKKYWFYLVALICPAAIAITRSLIMQTWITGNGNIISGDLQAQILPICYELWDKVHSGDSLFYTWHLTDGIDFNAIIGYLISPFTLIMLLVPRDFIPNFMEFTLIMKWCLCTWSMVYFFYHTKYNQLKHHKKMVSLFLGLAYGLSNAVISYIIYVQFMDVLCWFPLLLLLVEKMVDNGTWKLYYLVLTFCILSNNYIAFQVCLFLIFWFVLQLDKTTPNKFKKLCLFAASSVLAAVTSAGQLLVGFSLAQGRLGQIDTTKEYLSGLVIDITEFFKQFLIFEPVSVANNRTPNVYFTIFAIFLVLLFPIIKIGKKRKKYMIAMAVFFVLSFFIGAISLIWHLFNVPNGVYHRFMYLFVFYMLFMVLCVLNHLEDIKVKHVVGSWLICVLAYAYVFFTVESYESIAIYLISILLIMFYFIIMLLYCKKSISTKSMVLVIAIFGMIELIANAYNAVEYCDDILYFGENGFMNKACELFEQAELDKGERITVSNPTTDLGMMSGQNADSGFVSAINTDNKNLHERLGMASNSKVEFLTRGASPLVNLIFNVRYGLGESKMLFSDATEVTRDEFLQLYRMNRLAGLGYMVDNDIVEWDYQDKNCFQFQNDFVRKAVYGDDIFEVSNFEKIECCDLLGNTLQREKKYIENGVYSYKIKNKYGNEYDSIQLTFYMAEDEDLYMYMWAGAGANYEIQIFIDGEKIHSDIRPFLQSTYHIGNVKKGQRIAVCAVPINKLDVGEETNLMFTFGQFNEENYAKSYEKLSKNVMDIQVEESDYIKGSIHADEDGIMMTSIPADKGFRVYVDGVETKYETIADALIGVPLGKGDHIVEFRYRTPYFVLGWSISGAFFALYLSICYISSRKRKKQTQAGKEQ